MDNYSDTPSMDEILTRIKKALAERERKIQQEAFPEEEDVVVENFNDVREKNHNPSLEEIKDFSSKPEVASQIVDNIVKDDIFIKPNLKNNENDDVFVLTKEMKLDSCSKFLDVDFNLFCKYLSSQMSKDLAIAYMSPKIESWLLNNFWEVVAKSKRKN